MLVIRGTYIRGGLYSGELIFGGQFVLLIRGGYIQGAYIRGAYIRREMCVSD